MELLVYFASRPGEVISREELDEQVWGGVTVGYDSLTNAVGKLRKALDDSSTDPDIIETVPKAGYRLIAEVSVCPAKADPERELHPATLADETIIATRGSQESPRPRRFRFPASGVLTAFVLGFVAVIVAAVFWLPMQRVETLGNQSATSTKTRLTLPDKPSIAVLPFDNMSGDEKFDKFGDGLAENITAALSAVPELFVIARSSSFKFRGPALKVQKVAEELGVRYVMEGSVQISEDRIRITSQLVDAVRGHHIFSERYDRTLSDFFEVQDDISKRVLQAVEIKLTAGEQARIWHGQTKDLDAYLLYLRGHASYRGFTKSGNATARKLWMQAIAIDEGFAGAWVSLGWAHWQVAINGWSNSREQSLSSAEAAVQKAIAHDPEFSNSFAVLGAVALERRDYDNVLRHCNRAISFASATAVTIAVCADFLLFAGAEPGRSVKLIRRAQRLSPVHPDWYFDMLGRASWLAGKPKVATAAFREAMKRRPHWAVGMLAMLAVIAVETGDRNNAAEFVTKMLEKDPKATATKIARSRWIGGHFRDDAIRVRIANALHRAGLPE